MPDTKDAGTPASDDTTMFSRTAGRDIFGDLDDKMPELRIPAQVMVDARRVAASLGMDLTNFRRLVLYVAVYGKEHIASLQRRQLDRVQGNVPAPADIVDPSVVTLPGFLRRSAKP